MSAEKYHITQYCSIENAEVRLNGECVFRSKLLKASAFLKEFYRHLEMNYPKFYKMDALCKLALLCFEQLQQVYPVNEKYPSDAIALVLCNKHASLQTDVQHQKSIQNKLDYFPSPAVFVYTLPNIMLGEIAIRHKIKGENACLVQENFDAEQFYNYCNNLFLSGQTECIIGGWGDFFENDYSTHLLCIEKNKNTEHSLPFEKNTLKKLFTN
ncbi:MAG: hypothetical protein WD048_00635 [Chitinophagales bacterium]